MSELAKFEGSSKRARQQLLLTASALAFTVYLAHPAAAIADDTDHADHPTVWIELGGQTEFVQGVARPFTAPFIENYSTSPAFTPISPTRSQKPGRFSSGLEGTILFRPEDSSWTFSASVKYGRSTNSRYIHQQTKGLPIPPSAGFYKALAYYGQFVHTVEAIKRYAEFEAHNGESHSILDFQAGKDVGLGLFGKDSSSVLSFGVRMARFASNATVKMRARPDLSLYFFSSLPKYDKTFHHYNLSGTSHRSFNGIGPSVSWSGSIPLVGNLNDGELAFDWGMNGAVLFGKQKAKIHHKSTGYYFQQKYGG